MDGVVWSFLSPLIHQLRAPWARRSYQNIVPLEQPEMRSLDSVITTNNELVVARETRLSGSNDGREESETLVGREASSPTCVHMHLKSGWRHTSWWSWKSYDTYSIGTDWADAIDKSLETHAAGKNVSKTWNRALL